VLELDPTNRLALYNMAVAHERTGECALALHWTRRALKLSPRDATLHRLELRLRVLRWLGLIRAELRTAIETFTGRHQP
jgi:hypothetical protein